MHEKVRPKYGVLLALAYGIIGLILSTWTGYALMDLQGFMTWVVAILIIVFALLMYSMPENKTIFRIMIIVLVILSLLLGFRSYYITCECA